MGFMTYTFKLNPMTGDRAVLRAIHFVNESLRAHTENLTAVRSSRRILS